MQVGFFIGTHFVRKYLLVMGAGLPNLKPPVPPNFRFGEPHGRSRLPKSELDRARLIREARAIYESIFPTEKGPRRGVQRLTPESKVHQ
jgi:hypothetical protein